MAWVLHMYVAAIFTIQKLACLVCASIGVLHYGLFVASRSRVHDTRRRISHRHRSASKQQSLHRYYIASGCSTALDKAVQPPMFGRLDSSGHSGACLAVVLPLFVDLSTYICLPAIISPHVDFAAGP